MQTKITSFMCPQKGHNTGYKFFPSPPPPGKCYNFLSELTIDHKKHNKHREKKYPDYTSNSCRMYYYNCLPAPAPALAPALPPTPTLLRHLQLLYF